MAGVESKSGLKSSMKHMRLIWVDLIKAIALVWIFLNHLVERLFGYPYIANPSANWPLFGERLDQLRLLEGYGVWDIPLNLLRYIGWSGDQGVQLFLILSGFGLTWSALIRHGDAPLPLRRFYHRRTERIYPLWWGVHLLFVALGLVTGWGLSVTDPALYLSLIGIRITPALFYYFAPAWWYIGLLLQLYLVYPLLWEGLRRRGPLWLLTVSCAVAFVTRALGLLLFNSYMDAWQRGAIFITRLPEFVFGISLAAWLHRDPDKTSNRLRSPMTLLLALMSYALGTVLSLTLLGMAVAPFLLGVGVFVLLYAVLGRDNCPAARRLGLWAWVGRHSYTLYLLHHPLILLLVPVGLAPGARQALVGTVAVVLLTVGGAMALESAVSGAMAILGDWRRNVGVARTALRVATLGTVAAALLIGSELVVRWVAPQEVLGWGERPSLEPHPTFGWRLKPSQETHLRWESYDYQVTANSLGFPGPEYLEKPPGAFHVMVVGDAFTSAEGVDTDQAWPRLLEDIIAQQHPDRQVELLNFAITGYGPNQYQAVIEAFAPVYKPDLILIGFFVNEYQDVLWNDDQFRQSIGFDQTPQDSLYAIARLEHLQRLVRLHLVEPLKEMLLGVPRPHGYFLGNFAALERNRADIQETGRNIVVERLKRIGEIAESVETQIVIIMIPAPVQVCQPHHLAYYPKKVNLSDSNQFDLDLPQRITQEIATSLNYAFYDLRPALVSTNVDCPYQPHNMHWTFAGHQTVAAYLADVLVNDGYIP